MKADTGYAAQIKLFVVLTCLLALLVACAEVALPPGGPEDKQGPFLLGSLPNDGAVNVARDNKITLYFSEPILPPRTGKAIFISPRPLVEPTIKWKSDHVIIALADSFETDVTYLISAGSQIVDLRGNKVDSGLTIAFSYGPTIDSGTVGGHAYDQNGNAARGLYVGLYEEGWTDGYDSLYPAYVTQTSDDGLFRFDYLPAKEYRLIAFKDDDRDERFATHAEPYAVPDRPVKIAKETRLDRLHLTLVEQDSTTPGIITARQTDDGLIQVRLNRGIDLFALRQDRGRCWLTDTGQTKIAFRSLMYREIGDSSASSINAYFPNLTEGVYDLHLIYDTGRDGLIFPGLRVQDQEDQTPPTVISFEPAEGNLPIADEVVLTWIFSEPVTVDEEYAVRVIQGDSGQALPVTIRRPGQFCLEVVPDSLIPGLDYRAEMAEFEVSDLAGNILGDTLRSFAFGTANPDKLGWIVGTVRLELSDDATGPVHLRLRSPDGKRNFPAVTIDDGFRVELPAGDYLLSGYIDANQNDVRDYGHVWPYQFAETYAEYTDTITVRAKFETTGIEFTIE